MPKKIKKLSARLKLKKKLQQKGAMGLIAGSAEKCPECGSKDLVHDYKRAERYCGACGMVVEERQIDTSQEWRAFDYEQRQKRDRTGSFLTYTRHDKGLSTSIGDQEFSDLYKLTPSKRASFYRLKRWHRQVSTATERN
ncbi:TPA: transcription initiation factor IIB, partial [archaeon]|nr:transcription initiation factor IIB [Candidatus Naiadarchaeales archaeon SRR2090159.bin1288]